MRCGSHLALRSALALVLALVTASHAMAYMTEADVRELQSQWQEIARQLNSLGTPTADTSDEKRAAQHLALLDRHRQSVRITICGECKDHSLDDSSYRLVAEACVEPNQVTSSLTPQDYTKIMRAELHKMQDHLGRMSHESSPYKREQLMHLYYRHVVQALDRAKPRCGG